MVSKCLGVVLCKSSNKSLIAEYLNLVFAIVDHTSQARRQRPRHPFARAGRQMA
jgi:hypothetical protein